MMSACRSPVDSRMCVCVCVYLLIGHSLDSFERMCMFIDPYSLVYVHVHDNTDEVCPRSSHHTARGVTPDEITRDEL